MSSSTPTPAAAATAASRAYTTPPHKLTIPLEPFTLSIPDKDVEELKTLIRLSRVPKATFENLTADKERGKEEGKYFGITREWFLIAKEEWLGFDWRKQEKRINALPTYTTTITNKDGLDYTIHFAALFSSRTDAIPILLTHGWPGLYLEFLPMLEAVQRQYESAPDDLPFHLIAPSLPGYLYSSPPALDREFSIKDAAYLFDGLMQGLGFGVGAGGYLAQGGDLGSHLSLELGKDYEACKAIHLNMYSQLFPPSSVPEGKDFTPSAQDQFKASLNFGYALEHGTRPSTVGLAIGCNPLSLLAWIGEKYLDWADGAAPLGMETVLTFASLYWFTDTFPSSIYPYRYGHGLLAHLPSAGDEYLPAPTGYSAFPKDLIATPTHWVEAKTNLIWSREHESGGHFAALEQPKELWKDIEDFVAAVWEK